MHQDLLTEKAILLRDILSKLEHSLKEKHYASTFADKYMLQQLDYACKACIALGVQFIGITSSNSLLHPPYVFQRLVEAKVIDTALSKRLLSLIAFRKLIREAGLIKGKNIHLKITSRHIEDFHLFTQKLLLA